MESVKRNMKLREEQGKAVANGKFKIHIAQLLNQMGLVDFEKEGENWVDIVSSLAWEAASFVEPEENALNIEGCVNIKCVATGSCSESRLVKGLVFNKHAAHKNMPTTCTKPRILLIQGILGDPGLSAFNSMISQGKRMQDVKFLLDKLQVCRPDVIIMEKSVPFDLVEAILEMGATLVVNMKLSNMERIARYTGSPLLSVDMSQDQKLKLCDSFYFETVFEEHAQAIEGQTRPCSKNFMFLECSSRLDCTILLKGSCMTELEKIKCVLHCAVSMAYDIMAQIAFLLEQKDMFSSLKAKQAFPEDNGDCQPLSSTNVAASDLVIVGPVGEVKDGIRDLSDSPNILASKLTQNASRGTICERNHFIRIKFYGTYDVTLGSFFRDYIFNQSNLCKKCNQPSVSHIYNYVRHNKQLVITVKQIRAEDNFLGKSEEELWMWIQHGKDQPEEEGDKVMSKRVLLSDSACRLSFGRFLMLGLSNGFGFGHSLDKDCIYFFGSGHMIASLKFIPATSYTISVLPERLRFNNSIEGEWVQKETEHVSTRAMLMFKEVANYLERIETNFYGVTLNLNGSVKEFHYIQKLLEMETSEFEDNTKNALIKKKDSSAQTLLCFNKLRWELLLRARIWNWRLEFLLSCVARSSTSADQVKTKGDYKSTFESQEQWIWSPFSEIQERNSIDQHCNKSQLLNLSGTDAIHSHKFPPSITQIINEEGSRMHIPLKIGDGGHIISDYEGDISSVVSCALALITDTSQQAETLHTEVDLDATTYMGKAKYSVVCMYAREFHGLRVRCCPSELDYIASLNRCTIRGSKLGEQSKSFFARTLDDRFIIKEIKRDELGSFIAFAPNYFGYMGAGQPTCLAKILGIYQVTMRSKRGRETKTDVMVMENVLCGKNIARQYDIKGALQRRSSADANESRDVLLDQDFANDMSTKPLYMLAKYKRRLERAIWNDTAFLESINVMDYSLHVGVDHERRVLVFGIIDYLRRYTYGKKVESWTQSLILALRMNFGATAVVISPKEYKKRLRKFISSHMHIIPDP